MGSKVEDGASRKRGSAWPVDVMFAAASMVVDQRLVPARVAKQLGIPYTTLLSWVQKYRAGGRAALEQLPGRGGRAGERLSTGRARAPITHRSARPVGNRDLPKPDARREAVLAVKREQPHAGSRRIRDVVRRFFGIGTSDTTVRRLLKSEGLAQPRTPPKPKPKPRDRSFERAEPNQLWQSDLFTFLLRRHERIYVAAFLDDHSRYLVSLVMAHHQRSSLVLEALARGIADYGAPREILTDQGRQYTAWRGETGFEEELRRHGIRHIKSRPHHPQTCGKIERFWKTIWEEFLARTVFADFDDCQRRAALFVQHYNFQRPHQAIEGLTPADRFFRSAPQVRAAIEASVAENALRLARDQPARKPFYLVGRLGDRDLTISTSGAALKVRVGADETTIPLAKEPDHDQNTQSSRWHGGRPTQEAPAPADATVAEERPGSRRDREEPLPDAALGALGRDAGERCDRAGEDLAPDLLPHGDQSAQGDARGVEPARLELGGRLSGPLGGDRAHRGPRGAGEAPGAGQAPLAAPALPDTQVDPLAGEHGPSGTAAEERPQLDPEWQRSLEALEGEGSSSAASTPMKAGASVP